MAGRNATRPTAAEPQAFGHTGYPDCSGASWLCYFRALKLGDAARVAPIDKLSVVLVAIFGVALLGERLSGPNWLGVAMIGAGAILVAYQA